jgi:two-component system alkaline phosphatase synthesis response regulator PhoP
MTILFFLKREITMDHKKIKILIADDNQNIRDALTYLLEDEGYELLLAKDGAEALQKVRDLRPDILFLDIMMPEINGYDVCRTIKADPLLKDTYVIMLTAKGQVAEQERGKEVGANEYIVKPFSPMEILAKVKSIFRN